MKICLKIGSDCDHNPDELMIPFTMVYYLTVSFVILIQLLIIKKLFYRLPNSVNDLMILKAITFASFQVIVFNMFGIGESHDDVHINFRIFILAFQLLSTVLLSILMIVGFCEIQRVRKYDQMAVTDEDEMERGSGTDFYFMKVKFVFIAFGMLYSAILVVGMSLIFKLMEVSEETGNSLVSLTPSMEFARKLTQEDIDISF
ncbi:unnamed protein product [Chironomus riparius]|uniref:Uncharacterized protein n=1 Tax=Chironomus riparius TaxID=315576 RepID=A0A9N9WZF7_9DIPT|nr:unnamed protein product [Chironomus riparius]